VRRFRLTVKANQARVKTRCTALLNHSVDKELLLHYMSLRFYFNTLFVLGMTLNCIHIFIVTGSFLYAYWCGTRPASQRFFIIYLRIFIITYLITFLGNNSLSVLMCRKAVSHSINQFFVCTLLVFIHATYDKIEYVRINQSINVRILQKIEYIGYGLLLFNSVWE